jgi:hypothetical protein
LVAVALAAAAGYALFFFISEYVHHVCPACSASHFDADAARHFREIAGALCSADRPPQYWIENVVIVDVVETLVPSA